MLSRADMLRMKHVSCNLVTQEECVTTEHGCRAIGVPEALQQLPVACVWDRPAHGMHWLTPRAHSVVCTECAYFVSGRSCGPLANGRDLQPSAACASARQRESKAGEGGRARRSTSSCSAMPEWSPGSEPCRSGKGTAHRATAGADVGRPRERP